MLIFGQDVNKFTTQLYFLFIVITVLPVTLVIFWYVYSTNKIDDEHIIQRLKADALMIEQNFQYYKESELDIQTKIVFNLEKYNPGLEEYKNIIGSDYVAWIDTEKNRQGKEKLALSGINNDNALLMQLGDDFNTNNMPCFEVIEDQETRRPGLVLVNILPLKNSNHSGLLTVKKVPVSKQVIFQGPVIIKVYSGKDYKTSNLIYSNINDKFFKMFKPKNPPHGVKRPGPDVNVKLKGVKKVLKNSLGQVIATIEVGVPDYNSPFWIVKNPWLHELIMKIYVLGGVITFLGLILSAVVAFYLKKNFVDPVENLSKVIEKVSSGNLNVKVNTQTKQPELKETLESFNKMLEVLRDQQKLKDSFMANITHDIRTPLTAEQRTLEMLLKNFGKAGSEEAELVKGLQKNNEHLLAMLNQLLESYRFEEGKLQLKKSNINFQELIKQCFEQVKALSEEKNIILKSDIAPDLPVFLGDAICLKRCFLNLIFNALENIPKGSIIEVSGTHSARNIVLSVKDNGPGIPEDKLNLLFEKYYIPVSTERKIGSGLGLYICKKFIEAHKGKIIVESKYGEYSNFIITLPIEERT